MRYLLDTCVLSDFVKGEPATVARLLSVSPDEIAVPSITCFEVNYGLLLNKARARRLRPRIDAFFNSVHLLDFNKEDAIAAADIRARLRKRGEPIGPYDVLIAGVALSRGLVLVTANVKEFSRVRSLQIESWRS